MSHIPKVELHVHLEGTVSPALALRLAERNGKALPENLLDEKGEYNWSSFPDFLACYDVVSSVIQTAQDYSDVTYEYLMSIAKDGAIYAELTLGPDIPKMFGMDYMTHLNAVADGVERARKESGIEARFLICMIRHMGPQTAMDLMQTVQQNPHPLVVGVGLAGDETMHAAEDFAPAFRMAHDELGLGCTAHAGEVVGPKSVWETITHLPVTRIGHGVRSIEDAKLVKTLAEREITLEVCPHSNIALNVYPDLEAHPLRTLYDAGVVGSLNADDPPFFWTDLAKEYAVAESFFGFTPAELRQLSARAVQTSFADAALKERLLAKTAAA